MRIDKQYIPVIILLVAVLLVFGAFVVINLTSRGDDGDIIQTAEADTTGSETTGEATDTVDTSSEATAETAPGEAAETAVPADAGGETGGAPTPTSRSRAADSILIGTQVTPVLQSTAVSPGGSGGGSSTPTSMSRVTRSIRLDAQTSTPNENDQAEGESAEATPEATPETTESAQGGAGGSAAQGTPPPSDAGLPFAERNDSPSALEPRGPVAARQASLWWIMLAIGGVIYLAVMGFVLHIVGQRRREREYVPSDRRVLGLIVGGGVVVPILVVTLLFVLRNGRFHISHVNLAEPERPYTPQTDIDASFEENFMVYGRSILAPDLALLPKVDLSEIYRTDRGAFLDVWLPLAHRVWAGEAPHVTLADLLGALQTADMKEGTRGRLTAVLKASLPA